MPLINDNCMSSLLLTTNEIEHKQGGKNINQLEMHSFQTEKIFQIVINVNFL